MARNDPGTHESFRARALRRMDGDLRLHSSPPQTLPAPPSPAPRGGQKNEERTPEHPLLSSHPQAARAMAISQRAEFSRTSSPMAVMRRLRVSRLDAERR